MDRLESCVCEWIGLQTKLEADDDFCHPLFICSWEATNDQVW